MSGVAVSGVAVWTIFWKLHYASLLASIAYQVGTYGLAVAGALAIIGGFLGCFGIFYEQKAIILFVSNGSCKQIVTNFSSTKPKMKTSCLLVMLFSALTSANHLKKPNIVIIMADDMGFDDVSFHGAKQFLTPNIDALAYYGMILQNFYTPPMCTPSRAALMTGKYPFHTGMQHYVISNESPWGLPINETTIADVFKADGYLTNLVGKWHLGFARQEMLPTNRGFDTHYGYLGAYVDYYQRRALMPVENASMGYDFRRNFDLECSDEGMYMTDLLTRETEAVIKAHPVEKPLFLVVNHLAPHTANDDEPLQAPQEEIDKFTHINDERRRIYAAMVSKLDESIGNIIKALHDKGILDNTIVVFYADNGAPSVGMFSNTGSNYPMRGQKNTPWEGGIRVAASIWSPLLKGRNNIFKQNMYVADLLPTLANAAKIQLDPSLHLDGIDLWSELQLGGHETVDREIVHMLDDIWGVASYMSGNFKYINGTTLDGFASEVVTSRQAGEIDPRNARYANYIQESQCGRVLSKYETNPLTVRKINELRKGAAINCGNCKKMVNCNPLVEECLYRIDVDPCEQRNLAGEAEYASVLNGMRMAVEKYRSEAMEPVVLPGVPEGDPSVHDCTWTWYMDVPAKKAVANCGYQGLPCQPS